MSRETNLSLCWTQAQQIADPSWLSRWECALFPHQFPSVTDNPGREAIQPAGRKVYLWILTVIKMWNRVWVGKNQPVMLSLVLFLGLIDKLKQDSSREEGAKLLQVFQHFNQRWALEKFRSFIWSFPSNQEKQISSSLYIPTVINKSNTQQKKEKNPVSVAVTGL